MELRLQCWNGPKKNALVGAPLDAAPGMAVALPWKTLDREDRFAVYVVEELNGRMGLLFLKSYEKAYQAQQRVQQITSVMRVASLS